MGAEMNGLGHPYFSTAQRNAASGLDVAALLQVAATTLTHAAEAVIAVDASWHIQAMNEAAAQLFKIPKESAPGAAFDRFLREKNVENMLRDLAFDESEPGRRHGEIYILSAEGQPVPCHLRLVPLPVSSTLSHLLLITDNSRIRQVTDVMNVAAKVDPLTGLNNRDSFRAQVAEVLSRTFSLEYPPVMMFINLDHFQMVNEALGHSVGDQLLTVMATRLRHLLGSDAILARMGGDEFAALVYGLDHHSINVLAQMVLDGIAEQVVLGTQEVYLTASIGISLASPETDVFVLLKQADVALHVAKERGRGLYAYFANQMKDKVDKRLFVANGLRRAIERDELLLYYQPRVTAKDSKLIGVEALVRWKHPEQGMISPGDFVPIAEETGMILPMGNWVLRKACADAEKWRRDGLGDVPVAVNVSGRQLAQGGLEEAVNSALNISGFPAELLELELTESVMVENRDSTLKMLERLRARGVRVAMDDFGTGFSSLGYLKSFPLDILKIDQSFVRGVPYDNGDVSIVHAIIAMARSLGLEIVAEGVENPEQLGFLAEQGCQQIQGYLFGRPMPSHDFTQQLRSGQLVI